MFDDEPSNFAERLIQRKESARQTLHEASSEELRSLVRELFPDGAHPWAAPFSQFIEEHRSERAVRGKTSDGINFVYYQNVNRGIWYEYTGKAFAVGLLGQTSLRLLCEITSEAGHA